jgi:hypothetical protein
MMQIAGGTKEAPITKIPQTFVWICLVRNVRVCTNHQNFDIPQSYCLTVHAVDLLRIAEDAADMTARLRKNITDLSAGPECDPNTFRPVIKGMSSLGKGEKWLLLF